MDQLIKVQIYLPNDEKPDLILVSKDTTIKTIISNVKFDYDIVLFTGPPDNINATPLPIEATLEMVNMSCSDKSYIAEITIYNILDVSKYNVELYKMYSDFEDFKKSNST